MATDEGGRFTMDETLGFIGLGNMGHPIASNLIRAGYRLRVYNRTRSKAEPLLNQGAVLASRPAEVAERGGIVFTMLADDRAVEAVALRDPELDERLGAGGIHVSMSTISPATSRRLAEQHTQHGIAYVAAPVFGRPEAAAAGKLWVCLSGPREAKKRIQSLIDSFGQGSFDFGEDPGAANVVKLCGNFLIAAAIEAMAEAWTLAEKNGLDRILVAEMLTKTLFACPIYQGYGGRIAQQQYEPVGFRLALGLKDIDLALQNAAATQMPMPLGSLLHDRWLAGVAKGHSDLDWTAAALGVAEDAGLPVAKKAQKA
jgi:3-hydroxyisobutyrate dehydrogenase-like beta-hydroxyacid dehydrogenase